MESEENLTRETQNLEQNLSVENSLPLANTSKKPIEKQTESPSIISPKKIKKSLPNKHNLLSILLLRIFSFHVRN
jgi:hypothetical protein